MSAVAAGFRCHSGWAVLVVAAGSAAKPAVRDRCRIELVDAPLPRQPYHAVAEAGASARVIDEVADAATAAATAALRSVDDLAAVGLIATERRIPTSLDQILASHALLHAAEGHLFERAVIDAAADAGVPVHVVDPKSVVVPDAVDGLGRILGPPWQKDHKWATVAALAAFSSTGTAGRGGATA